MDNYVFARPDWQKHAACRGMMVADGAPNFFIPRGGDQVKMLSRSLRVCDDCKVSQDCLEYAVRLNIQVGVWGGTTAWERREIRRERGLNGVTEDDYFEDLRDEARQVNIDREMLRAALERQLATPQDEGSS